MKTQKIANIHSFDLSSRDMQSIRGEVESVNLNYSERISWCAIYRDNARRYTTITVVHHFRSTSQRDETNKFFIVLNLKVGILGNPKVKFTNEERLDIHPDPP